MGDGARQKLIANDIEIVSGASGSVEAVINAYLDGSLKSNDAGCSDHDHSHSHGGCTCGH
jgi:predicted Fe-Mo cluster-binding NifX family protein